MDVIPLVRYPREGVHGRFENGSGMRRWLVISSTLRAIAPSGRTSTRRGVKDIVAKAPFGESRDTRGPSAPPAGQVPLTYAAESVAKNPSASAGLRSFRSRSDNQRV